MIRIP
jgi:hypothetical protein